MDPWGLSHKHRTELRKSSIFESLGRAENLKISCLRSLCAILSEPCQQFYCTNGLDCVLNVNGNGFSEKVQHCSCSPLESQVFFGQLEIPPVIFLAGSHRLFSRLQDCSSGMWPRSPGGPVPTGRNKSKTKCQAFIICPCWHIMLALFKNTTSTRILCGLPTSGVQSCRVEPTFPE